MADDLEPRHLHAIDGGASDVPTLEEMLEAIPVNVEIAVDLDDLHDPNDPALTPSGRRFCIATRRAGGRCTAPPLSHGLLCGGHTGDLDPREGALARAQKLRNQALTAEERSRLAQLGTRGVIRDTLGSHPELVRRATLTLLEDAAAGDRSAAKLLGPYINQALGMPTETVEVTQPTTADDLSRMDTQALETWIAARRAAREQAETASGG